MNFQTLNRQRKFIVLAALAGLIAMFLPWVTVSAGSIFGGPDDQSMSISQNGMHGSGIIVFLFYICAAGLSLLGDQTRTLEKSAWLGTIAAGAIAVLFTIILLTNTPTGSMGFAKSSIGFGAWISALATISILASAWLLRTPGYTIKDSFNHLTK
jgi:asparagine N-glycosylation enzyme membrane subunit Stt3